MVNLIVYGYGYLFNNLVMDFLVFIYEGIYVIIIFIVGFEGELEGGVFNEG